MENNIETNNQKGKSKILYFIILIIVVVVCYFAGYFVGYKISESKNDTSKKDNEVVDSEQGVVGEENSEGKDADNEDTKTEEEVKLDEAYTPKCNDEYTEKNLVTNIETGEYTHFIDYIKEQENVSISYEYCSNEYSDEEEDAHKIYNLSADEIEELLNEMKKHESIIFDEGVGGGACVPLTTIKYIRNDKEYDVTMWGDVLSTNDGNVYKIIDDNYNKKFDKKYCAYMINAELYKLKETLELN